MQKPISKFQKVQKFENEKNCPKIMPKSFFPLIPVVFKSNQW